ncbi:MAG: hypothetical protein ABIL58_09665 [Pseudomonadota bacterium]
MTATTVIVFDYSGTLSMGAVDFGRNDRLQAALERSGLSAFGVDTPAVYWQRIVRPTWPVASVTARPFSRYIVAQVLGSTPPDAPPDAPPALTAAAGRFVEAYLAASDIAAPWRPLLRRLCRRSDVRVIIATDHYAEATVAIIGHLATLGLSGAPLAFAAKASHDIRVANSADLGCRKADPSFWRKVASVVGGKPAALMLVDDFGAAESAAAGYGAPEDVARRKRLATEALRGAGDWAVHVHAVCPSDGGKDAFSAAVAAAVDAIGGILV